MAETELACSTEFGETEADSGTQGDANSNEEVCDQDDSTNPETQTNYDSSDGALLRCERCDFEGVTAAALVAHSATCAMDDRSSRKMFECDVCQMKFSNGANMRRHKMRHTGVKPYECRVCQKRFFRKDHLAEHFTTHTKTLPFHCPICNRGFQRQIAMRAHFQNEHVGQNDVIKSCPLCTYRAGSMKSLRVHFFNRHGIDLDRPSNPGEVGGGGGGSDSGDSGRSADNATPPMHFLTPHVEISMADPPQQAYSPTPQSGEAQESNNEVVNECIANGVDGPGSPQSGDSPSSSGLIQGEVTPSVSLIPIKQEVEEEKLRNGPVNLSTRAQPLASLIKVSPLKSLLREEVRPRREPPTSTESTQAPDSVWRPPTSTPRRLHCLFCGIMFPDQTLYFLHKGCHSDSNPWKCNICGEQCTNVYDFNSHLLSKTHQ